MSILKYIQRLERMHLLIKRGSTGSTDDFASKMGLSRRQLLEDLSDLRQMGAPIKFESSRQTYVYEFDWQPLSHKLQNDGMQKVKGGRNFISVIYSGFYDLHELASKALNKFI